MKKLAKRTEQRYQANVREVAEALGIPITPNQWVEIRDEGRVSGRFALTGRVEIAVWESADA